MKAAAITALVLATLVVAAVLALSIGVPVPFVGNVIAKRFENESGYRLTLGTPTIRLLPSPNFALGRIAVLDGNETRLTAERVEVSAPLSSLLSGKPVLTEVAVIRPILLAPLSRDRPARSAGTEAKAARTIPEGLAIERFVVEEGAVEFRDQAGQIENSITAIAVKGSLKADRSLDVTTTSRLGEQELRFAFKGTMPRRDDNQGKPFDFKIEAPGMLVEPVTGTADVRKTGSTLAINSLAGTIAQSGFSGWASLDFVDKPLVKMDVAFQKLSIAAVKPGADPAGGLDEPWSDKSVSLDGLNFVDAEVQLSATELAIDRFRFAPITVGAILSKGVLKGGITKTGIYGGQMQGTLAVDASAARPSHALRLDLLGVQALPLLTDVASFTTIDGRMQARIDVRGAGASVRAIMSSLSGAVDLSVKDGEIRSVNIAKMIRAVGANIVDGWQKDAAEKTDLTELSAFFRIQNGQAATDNFKLVGPLVRVTGAGTADLGGKTLQFRVEPKLVLSLQGQGASADPVGLGVPVTVQGPWGSPRIYPELAGILDNPDAAFAKLKEMGGGLLGSGSSAGGKPPMQGLDSLMDRFKSSPSATQPLGPSATSPEPPPQGGTDKLQDIMKGLFGR
jgi:AsmA protein